MSKKAFTLSEVLITLGIIGIISALTIPTLIKNYQEKIRDNQFKKAYAILNQALRMTIGNYDYTPRCYYPLGAPYGGPRQDCEEFWTNFRKNLKVVKYCEKNAFALGCIPHYDGVEVILKENHKNDSDYDEEYWENFSYNMDNFRTNNIKTVNPAFVLNDGTIIVLYKGAPLFFVDVNGINGENAFGHDVFAFKVYSDGKKFYLAPEQGTFFVIYNNGGISTAELVRKLFGDKQTGY